MQMNTACVLLLTQAKEQRERLFAKNLYTGLCVYVRAGMCACVTEREPFN